MTKGKRFEEQAGAVELQEAGEAGPRRIGVSEAIVAGVVNGNGRRYPVSVIESAVAQLKGHLNESAGQGRVKQVLGEAEHPSDKNGRSNLLETVVKWDEVSFDGTTVRLGGVILGTSKGKDILALMEGGVKPGVSLRGYGESKVVKEGGRKIEEVTDLHLTGFDLVLEPSFKNEAVLESIQVEAEKTAEEIKMSEELEVKLTEAERKAAELQKKLEEAERTAAESQKAIEEAKTKDAIQAAIKEATKDLPFGDKLNGLFVEAIKGGEYASPEAVKKFAEGKRKEYGALAAQGLLNGLGFDEKKGEFKVIGDVLENETGTPEFARASFEISESLRKRDPQPRKDLSKNESQGAIFTRQLLERFDVVNRQQLLAEARLFNEAEAASDLNLPYNYSRAMILEAFPSLVAANIFDVGVMSTPDERIYFEQFVGETGFEVDITDDDIVTDQDAWVALTYKRIVPGTVVVTSKPAGTTYEEGTDYIIDYELGKIKTLSTGTPIVDGANVLVDYTYRAIRSGEDAEIQRAKMQLSYQLVTAAADRVSDYITDEAIKFSRATLGWDAVARTMANMVRQIRLDIDRGLIEKALGPALAVANNSGGTWVSATDPWSTLAEYIGYAKVKVLKRFYEPTFILMSDANADYLSNWESGFTRTGFPNALLDAAGFAGSVKGLPIFRTTQMRDSYILIGNRQMVSHRVFSPMTIKGPFQTFGSNRKLVAAEQYYAEEYNASICPLPEKSAVVKVS